VENSLPLVPFHFQVFGWDWCGMLRNTNSWNSLGLVHVRMYYVWSQNKGSSSSPTNPPAGEERSLFLPTPSFMASADGKPGENVASP